MVSRCAWRRRLKRGRRHWTWLPGAAMRARWHSGAVRGCAGRPCGAHGYERGCRGCTRYWSKAFNNTNTATSTAWRTRVPGSPQRRISNRAGWSHAGLVFAPAYRAACSAGRARALASETYWGVGARARPRCGSEAESSEGAPSEYIGALGRESGQARHRCHARCHLRSESACRSGRAATGRGSMPGDGRREVCGDSAPQPHAPDFRNGGRPQGQPSPFSPLVPLLRAWPSSTCLRTSFLRLWCGADGAAPCERIPYPPK